MIERRRGVAVLAAGVFVAMSQSGLSQTMHPKSLPRQAGDIAEAKAIAEVQRFRGLAVLGAETMSRIKWRLAIDGSGRHYGIDSPSMNSRVDARQCHVTLYYNTQRVMDQVKGRLDRAKRRFRTEDEAKAVVLVLARRVSGLGDLRLLRFTFRGEGQPKDQIRSGYVGGIYLSSGEVVVLSVDITDGVLINYHRHKRKV